MKKRQLGGKIGHLRLKTSGGMMMVAGMTGLVIGKKTIGKHGNTTMSPMTTSHLMRQQTLQRRHNSKRHTIWRLRPTEL